MAVGDWTLCTRTLVDLFERQAARRGEAVAVVDASGETSYADLNAHADRLAARLEAGGVRPEHIVGVYADRSVRFVTGMLAALKAGAAYLPLDPKYPRARLEFMITDSGATAVVGDGVAEVFDGVGAALLLDHDDGGRATNAMPPPAQTRRRPTGSNAAYVIYTSGTTGQPKGVVVEHRNVIGLFDATRDFGFDARDRWSALHSFSFDFSVWEIWGALLHGGRVVIAPDDVIRDPELLARFLRENEVSVLNQTPSAFRGLAETAMALPDLRLVIFGGEPVDLSAASRWLRRRLSDAELINMFGITETTVHVTRHRVTLDECAQWSGPGTPVGRPLPGASVRLLDVETRAPVRPGESGEIWVGGFGVAREYLGRPELTAERFVVDEATGDRLYRSGDLGQLTKAGELVHLGRIDSQVNVRGYRIELGEVESALVRVPGVERAAAIAVGSGADATLVAVVVPDRDAAPAVRRLVEHRGQTPLETAQAAALAKSIQLAVAATLPPHAVPSRVELRAVLPLTTNGKLDRKRLVESITAGATQPATADFSSSTEREVAAVFGEVLRRADVDGNSHFFELGGQSLTAVAVIRRLRDRFGDELPLQLVFDHPRVDDLSAAIDGRSWAAKHRRGAPTAAQPHGPAAQLTEAEEPFWVHQRMYPTSSALNDTRTVRIARPWAASMPQVAAAVLSRQPSLRQIFPLQQGIVRKLVAEACIRPLALGAVTEAEWTDATAKAAGKPFDLARELPIRVYLAHADDDMTLAAIIVHHIASDRVSMDILVDELARALASADGAVPSRVEAAPSPVSTPSAPAGASDAYWLSVLAPPDPLPLPAGRERLALAPLRAAAISFEIELPPFERLADGRTGLTANAYLVAAFAATLHELLDAREVSIGIPNDARDEATRHELGCFVTTAPLLLRRSRDLRALVRETQRQLIQILEHGAPSRTAMRSVRPRQSVIGHNPFFQAVFAYHDAPIDRALSIGPTKVEVAELRPDQLLFDLDLIVERVSGPTHKAWLGYRESSFGCEDAQLIVDRFQATVQGFAGRTPTRVESG